MNTTPKVKTGVSLPQTLHERLKRLAYLHRTSVSGVIEQAVIDYLKHHDPDDAPIQPPLPPQS